MPTSRSEGQKLVNVPMNDKFIEAINDAVKQFNYDDRSKFIREAIAEKLERLGKKVPRSFTAAPLRIGKGGGVAKRGKSRAEGKSQADF